MAESICQFFFVSVIGCICGIGSEVIIKPVLDAFGLYSVSTYLGIGAALGGLVGKQLFDVVKSMLENADTVLQLLQ